jgi:hypothetical protein
MQRHLELFLRRQLARFLRGAIVLLANLAMATLMIGAIWALDALFRILWHGEVPRLLGQVPLDYIFHGADLAVLLLFLLNGVLESYRTFRDGMRNDSRSPDKP